MQALSFRASKNGHLPSVQASPPPSSGPGRLTSEDVPPPRLASDPLLGSASGRHRPEPGGRGRPGHFSFTPPCLALVPEGAVLSFWGHGSCLRAPPSALSSVSCF